MNKLSRHISRRSFLQHTAGGVSLAALGLFTAPYIKTARAKAAVFESKGLYATTDYVDNVAVNRHFMDKKQLNDLNACVASLGVTRHIWNVDTVWSIYEDYPHGFDLLAEAVEAAHANGLEFYAQIKPFEGGAFHDTLPLSFPYPENAVAFRDMRGISPIATPFAARNLHMNLKRRPGTYEYNSPVTSIRLVKEDDKPTRIRSGHLSIWTSASNNGFVRYTGPFDFRESVDWRFCFPEWRPCRILHFENLQIPAEHTFILIKCTLADNSGDFSNEKGSIIELVNPGGEMIPYYLTTEQVFMDDDNVTRYQTRLSKQLIRYLQLPEVDEILHDPARLQQHYKDFFNFKKYKFRDKITLDRTGHMVATCGKPEYCLGTLHPIYSEVREHWLELVRYCLDRGADGINFRVANHTRPRDHWEYGFNEPVLEASGGKTDYATIRRINGNAYTEFLTEARELIKSKGKGMMIHLHAHMLRPDDRRWNPSPSLPPNFEWQWQKWVTEIADELEIRGYHTLRPWNRDYIVDIFSAVTRAAKKPLYLQSDRKGQTNEEGRKIRKLEEFEYVKNHPGLDGIVLYETANYTYINEDGRVVLKPYFKELFQL
jgi:hypothetical protein